jgi:hypothetical protein
LGFIRKGKRKLLVKHLRKPFGLNESFFVVNENRKKSFDVLLFDVLEDVSLKEVLADLLYLVF